MRLGDLDIAIRNLRGMHPDSALMYAGAAATIVEETPVIDPETLPIVRELREQLAKVTAERDAALMDMRRTFKIGAGCIICKRAEECEDRRFGFGDCPRFEWGASNENL